MKTSPLPLTIRIVFSAFALLFGQSTYAASLYWDTNTTGLWSLNTNWWTTANGTTSPAAAPGASDTVIFNGTGKDGATIVQLGGGNSTLGMTFANTGTTLISSNSTTSRTLTVGTSGITVNSTAGAVTIGNATNSANVTLDGSQTWTNNSGNTTTIANTVNRSAGQFLNFAGTGTFTAANTFNLSNNIVGPWAITGSGTSLSYVTKSSNVIGAYSGGTAAATAADLTDTTGAVNYDLADATGTIGAADFSGNTIRYTGAVATLAPGATSFTVNGLMNAGTGKWTIGANPITIGSTRELVVTANTQDIEISSAIQNNGGGASSLAYSGGGTLNLSGNNTFTGGLNIGAGTVLLNNPGALNSTTANAVSFTGTAGTLTLNGNSVAITGLSSLSALGASGSTNLIVQNANAAGATLTVGGTSTSSSFYGVLRNGAGGGALALTKQGSGTLTLYGANTIGNVTVNDGTLFTENSMTFGNLSVASSKTFQFGSGSAAYTININGLSGAGTVTTNGSGGFQRTLNVGNGNATADFSGVLTQASNRALVLTKLGSGTQTLSGSSNNTQGGGTGVGFDTYVQAGALVLNKTAATALPGDVFVSGGTLQLSGTGDNQIANTSAVNWSGGAIDLNGRSETIGVLTLSVNSTGNNTLNIATGKTFSVAGLTLGRDIAGGQTKLVTAGNGSFSSTGNFVVGVSSASDNTLTNVANFSTLSSFTFNGTNFTLGGPGGADLRNGSTTVTLSSTLNDVTATTLNISSSGNRNHNTTLNFAGTSAIKADTINVAAGYNGDGDLIATSGSLNIRNKAGTGAANMIIADRSYNGTGTINTGIVNLAGTTVNALIGNLTVADNTGDASRTGTSTGTLIFGTTGDTTSTMDVTTIRLTPDPTGVTVGTSTATIDIRGGTFRFDTMNVGVDRTGFTANTSLLLKGGTFAALNSTANTITGLDTLQIGGVGGVTFGQTSGGTGGLNITATAITLGASTTQTVNVATTLTGTISATTNTMEKLGAGTLTLAGTASNLNTGQVTVAAGTLELNKTAGINAVAGNLTIGDGTGGSNADSAKLLASNQIADTAAVRIHGTSGTLNVNGFSETIGSLADTGTVTPGGSSVALGSGSLTVGDATSTTFSGNITGTGGSLTKQGAGTLTLEGDNAHTGITTIAAGTLILSGGGTLNTSAGITVATGATLTNDTLTDLNPALSLGEGSTLSGAGNFTPAAMTLTGDLSDGFIPVTAGSTLTKAGALTFTLSGVTNGTYPLFTGMPAASFTSVNVGGTPLTYDGGDSLWKGNVGGFDYAFSDSLNTLSVVPEPATWVLAGLGFTLILMGARSRRARHLSARIG